MPENHKEGIVYLVGAGPGNTGLMTMRGMEVLRKAQVVVYDYLVNPRLIEEARDDAELIYVGKKANQHTLSQDGINALLVEKCAEGLSVIRLKGGDPFVFGRGGEEALALKERGFRFEIVPGVTSGISAPAFAGIPVTHRGYTSTMAFVTGHEKPGKENSDIDWKALATGIGTVVFYMGVGNLPNITERLIENGRAATTPIALIQWGTHTKQKTLTGTLSDIVEKVKEANFKPPAMIIVGEVVGLREDLNWFETRPLFGRSVLVTRSRTQASDLTDRLEELGAETIEFPVIRIAPPGDPAPLADAVRRASEFDWIVFTSVNGVDAFFDALRAEGLDTRSLGSAKVAAIGPSTCRRAETHGLLIDLVPPKYVAESVVEEFQKIGDLAGKRFLLPTADLARSFLPEALEKEGAEVSKIDAYRTLLEEPENIGEIRSGLVDGTISMVSFTSSSTVRNFAKLVGEETLRDLSREVSLISIGPETTKTLRQFTEAEIHQADAYTIDGLVEAIQGV